MPGDVEKRTMCNCPELNIDCVVGRIKPDGSNLGMCRRIYEDGVGVVLNSVSSAQGVVESRESAHGDYAKQSDTARALKHLIHINDKHLNAPQRESLDMIAVKISRILHGNPNEPDHWLDIAGYATLVHNILTKGTHL